MEENKLILNIINNIKGNYNIFVSFIPTIENILDKDVINHLYNKLEQYNIEKNIKNIKELNHTLNETSKYIDYIPLTLDILILIYQCKDYNKSLFNIFDKIDLNKLNILDFSESKIITLKKYQTSQMHISEKLYIEIDDYISTFHIFLLNYITSKLLTKLNISDLYNIIYMYYNKNDRLIDMYVLICNYILEFSDITELLKNKIINDLELFKNKSLDVNYDKLNITNGVFDNYNTLQNFDIITNNEYMSLYDLCYKLFDIKNDNLINLVIDNKNKLQIMINELIIILNNHSNKQNIKCGIIIMYNQNQNIFFNIDALLNINSFNNLNLYTGINEQYIKLYDILKSFSINNSVLNKNSLININIDNDTNNLIILKTNNFIDFCTTTNKINNLVYSNIFRNSPSLRIQNYNKIIEDEILKSIDNKLKVKYNDIINLDYSNKLDDNTYKYIIDEIILNIKKYFISKDNKDINITDLLVNDDINAIIFESIIKYYEENINTTELDIGVYLTYLCESDNILKKFKKEMIDYLSINKVTDLQFFLDNSLKIILNNIINVKTNIYDKIIEKNYITQNLKRL